LSDVVIGSSLGQLTLDEDIAELLHGAEVDAAADGDPAKRRA
jgi:hypothetical protein